MYFVQSLHLNYIFNTLKVFVAYCYNVIVWYQALNLRVVLYTDEHVSLIAVYMQEMDKYITSTFAVRLYVLPNVEGHATVLFSLCVA